MILSDGKNKYKDNKFSFWEWSAPVLQTHDEVLSKLRELKLEGRVVKNIYCVGMAYNWREDDIADAVYNTLDGMTSDERANLPNARAFLPEGVYLSCFAEIDEPLLIEFEDGDILCIDYSEGSCIRLDMNTIPKDIEFGTNRPTFYPNRLFANILGREIVEVQIVTSTVEKEFTGSHGLKLEEQSSYIVGLNIVYDDLEQIFPQRALCFSSHYDFGIVELRDHTGDTMKIHAPDIKHVVEGFIDDALLNSQEEFELNDFDM